VPSYTKRQVSVAIERAAARVGNARHLADLLGVPEAEVSRAVTCRREEEHDVPLVLQRIMGLDHGVYDYYRTDEPVDAILERLAPTGAYSIRANGQPRRLKAVA